MIASLLVFAYLGPETMLPMTSVVAGVAGVVMLLGRSSLSWAAGKLRSLMAPRKAKPKPPARTRKIGAGPVRTVGKPRVRA
jgi:hypothetical protein